ncbi:hypothetical protein SADUNF_Sadunf18G0119100 [Salix dunnii]|uniref:RRM domain-containing protein n=1 Tax=Salix dunnii TaxID=1413687 RepID=A0A835J4S6_9ROSI|nr:hypothetical protein SADUNF_Sadunf18G0119100 [Salix dunnii]
MYSMKFNNVYVKNSVESTTDEGLKDIFTEHGAKSKCFEFVNFEKAEDADEAVKTLDGKEIEGKECYVGKWSGGEDLANNFVETMNQADLSVLRESPLLQPSARISSPQTRTSLSPISTGRIGLDPASLLANLNDNRLNTELLR